MCLHLLAKHGRENAAAIFSMLLNTAPRFPLDKQDEDGHTREYTDIVCVQCVSPPP